MKKILGLFILALFTVSLVACGTTNAAPTFSGVGDVRTFLNVEFDPLEGVKANDKTDGDITADIKVVSNNVNVEAVGNYQVKYEVANKKGTKAQATRNVIVAEVTAEEVELAQYLNGVDLSKLPAKDKDALFAAAERYLLDNVYAGVPLYSGASRNMYAERVQLFSPTFNGVLGFGTAFSQFSQDDSNVFMNGSQKGNVGEYTWRTTYATDPVTLNQWISDDQASSDFIDLFTGSLYGFVFDQTKTGYEITPSMAKSAPVAVDPVVINGKTYAKTWQIEVRDDLVWKYHPNAVLTGLPSGHEVINAEDFLWTWQHALKENWLRARTGGGDFVTNGVKGAADFVAGKTPIENVGLRIAEGKPNTLEIEYITEKSAFDIKYTFASTSMTPIHQQMLEKLGESYNKTPETTPSSGIYYLDVWNSGQLVTVKKNELHPDAAMYYYTGQQFRFLTGSDQIFEEFLQGRLDAASVPSGRVVEFQTDPRVKVAPDPTTWRMHINAFGTVANRDAFIANNPGMGLSDTYVPEPILMYKEMRQALYYGFDREYAAIDVVKTYLPAHTLFTSTYFLDAESGTSVRGLAGGQAVFDDFAGSSFGFVPDAAIDLFKQAVTQAIADGYYEKGTQEKYTVIDFSFTYGSDGSTAAQAMVAEIKKQYEARLVDNENFVKITLTVADVSFPDQYYNYMMKGATDLGLGGISGSLLNAPSFLDVFSDDNRGGFTLSWGIDTSTANIVVGYDNLDGDYVYEKWGFNALIMALNGKTYVRNGVEQKAWNDTTDLINAVLDMSGLKSKTITADETIGAYVLGKSFVDKAAELKVDAVLSFIVVTETDEDYLFILSKKGDNYELVVQNGLHTSAEAAIQAGLGDYKLNAAVKLKDDADIAANAYMASIDLLTLQAVADEVGVPVGILEVYAINRGSGTSLGDDAYAVLKVDKYYIAWEWL